VEWNAQDVVSTVINPFTGKAQVQSWQASWLEAVVTLPAMQRVNAGNWIAFLAQLQGQNGVFYFGDGLATVPQGSASGTGVTAGSNQGPYTITSSGWDANQSALLMPGDWLQIGWRMYMCLDMAASDGAGNSSFAIWPQIREIPAAGTAIVTTNPVGLFRLATNTRKWSESYLRTWGLSFQIREAI
jgi:hypothetical protein